MAEWRDVPGFEGELVACSDGRIARLIGFEYSGYEAISVSKQFDGHPTLTANLSKKGDSYTIGSHRIIALTFLGEPPAGKPDVNHIDGVKKNNAAANLEWCTRAENLAHAHRIGLCPNLPRKYTQLQYQQARELYATGDWTLKKLAAHLTMTVGGLWHAIHAAKVGRERPWPEVA